MAPTNPSGTGYAGVTGPEVGMDYQTIGQFLLNIIMFVQIRQVFARFTI